ncbi:hypothetical protein EGR_06420 [Echinococcus granulosus]|uniref:Uncharacterized protein n=1 Tax=Echinococcus granulosus TaxID=6210 RepID=W6UYV2_ECHGR|nr:hypothetical protein EGR_06420 [Echinococcus granulosus]EUB58749.1 hypothetical protein EGR_06420 [Echinococcus granulosus]
MFRGASVNLNPVPTPLTYFVLANFHWSSLSPLFVHRRLQKPSANDVRLSSSSSTTSVYATPYGPSQRTSLETATEAEGETATSPLYEEPVNLIQRLSLQQHEASSPIASGWSPEHQPSKRYQHNPPFLQRHSLSSQLAHNTTTRRDVNTHDCIRAERVECGMTHVDAGCLLIGLWRGVGAVLMTHALYYRLSTLPMVEIHFEFESNRAMNLPRSAKHSGLDGGIQAVIALVHLANFPAFLSKLPWRFRDVHEDAIEHNDLEKVNPNSEESARRRPHRCLNKLLLPVQLLGRFSCSIHSAQL